MPGLQESPENYREVTSKTPRKGPYLILSCVIAFAVNYVLKNTQQGNKMAVKTATVFKHCPSTLFYGPEERMIQRAAEQNGIDPALLKAIIWVESSCDPYAVSSKGAQGLMQLMPRFHPLKNPFLPKENITRGAEYLAQLLQRFSHEEAVAAYNAGPESVLRYGGIPPFPETQNYVQRVAAAYKFFSLLPD